MIGQRVTLIAWQQFGLLVRPGWRVTDLSVIDKSWGYGRKKTNKLLIRWVASDREREEEEDR